MSYFTVLGVSRIKLRKMSVSAFERVQIYSADEIAVLFIYKFRQNLAAFAATKIGRAFQLCNGPV